MFPHLPSVVEFLVPVLLSVLIWGGSYFVVETDLASAVPRMGRPDASYIRTRYRAYD